MQPAWMVECRGTKIYTLNEQNMIVCGEHILNY